MTKKTKLVHPADPKASVEATPEFEAMYRSQGWVEPEEKK